MSKNSVILNGETIILRDWVIADLTDYTYWNTGHHEWMDFNGPYYPNLTTEELDKQVALYNDKIIKDNWPNPRRTLVIANKSDNAFIGTVNWYWQSKETNWMSIGIAICDDKQWSKGIGYQALKIWIDYLFKSDLKLVRLDLRTWSGNLGMIKLGEKLGFKMEARFRNARIVNGQYYDSIGMGILKDEWNLTHC